MSPIVQENSISKLSINRYMIMPRSRLSLIPRERTHWEWKSHPSLMNKIKLSMRHSILQDSLATHHFAQFLGISFTAFKIKQITTRHPVGTTLSMTLCSGRPEFPISLVRIPIEGRLDVAQKLMSLKIHHSRPHTLWKIISCLTLRP